MKPSSVCVLPLVILITTQSYASNPPKEIELLNRRIQLLESALAPATPQSLVKTFAEAIKQRNGAVQYMLFCPALQKNNLKTYEALNWVTGTSSPSCSDYQFTKVGDNQFDIQFSLSLQGKVIGTTVEKLKVIPVDPSTGSYQHYCITSYVRSTSMDRPSVKR